MSLVIVAIPREDDPVWKISSEKVPHLTLLFLGDGQNPQRGQIAQFVEHAASTSLTRFGLDVDRRGELGDDKADVLFFQDNWELPRLRDFRSQLLKDHNIKTAYHSTEQFEGWTPHLTLGYPETPAKPTSERIYWVQFDRIALWEGDFEGPEFILKSDYPMEVMMSETDLAARGRAALAHYGVKGMKWGHRKPRDESARAEKFAPKDVTVKTEAARRGKTKVKAEGGENQPAHEDALAVAGARQKMRKSGTHALSNQELAEVARRLQLEQQVQQLESQQTAGGKKFVKQLVTGTGKSQANRVANQEAGRYIDGLLADRHKKK